MADNADNNECFANYEVTPKPPCEVPFKVHTNSITGGCKPDKATEADLIWVRKEIPDTDDVIVFPCTINNGEFQTTACHLIGDTVYTLDEECNLVSRLIPDPAPPPPPPPPPPVTYYKALPTSNVVLSGGINNGSEPEYVLNAYTVPAAVPEYKKFGISASCTVFARVGAGASDVSTGTIMSRAYSWVRIRVNGTFLAGKFVSSDRDMIFAGMTADINSSGRIITELKAGDVVEMVLFRGDHTQQANVVPVDNFTLYAQTSHFSVEEI